MIELNTYELGILSAAALIAGIFLLVKGGDWTIDAAVAIAQRTGISSMMIGATIVAFGTSLPELFTSVNANLTGYPGISLGNVVGSNIANILFVLGAAGLVAPMTIHFEIVRRDLVVMLGATIVLVVGMLIGIFPRWAGILMFLFLATFIVYQYRRREIDTEDIEEHELSSGKAVAFLLAGFLALTIGSEFLVRGAVVAGGVIGVPEAIIGLTVVAIGTSLPELTASLAAASKGETEMVFGNLIGSNSFNILWIVGATAAIKPLSVDPSLLGFELWFMAAVAFVFAAVLYRNLIIGRAMGTAFLVAYTLFTLYHFGGATP